MGLGDVGGSSQRLIAVGVQYAPLAFRAVLTRVCLVNQYCFCRLPVRAVEQGVLTTLALSRGAFIASAPATPAPFQRRACTATIKIEHYPAFVTGLVLLLRQMTLKLATKKSSIAILK